MTTHSAACSLAIRGAAFPPGTGSPASSPPPPPHGTLPHQLQALRPPGSRIWLSPCALLPSTPALSRQG